MLLTQLTLNNIRSYSSETIAFPQGSILLAGDIGSGKSSLLMAIEFALFGASRPDLPAEALLRKGTTQGSIELSFILQDKHITIKRSLKKEKDTIKQLPGHIIINDIKKELMPTELKAEILALLGYPEDMLTKNKNYLFRY
ncbi:TPA: AAA family ATPase, partial [Candidatus Woesearchaeota archaeon]|nr:AAA family ATPase [Candidatus Woesearchaeota archaeon]